MAIAFKGTLFRALNPRFAAEPLSGRGAALYGGRFNAKGVEALYLSLSPLTALREANQVGALQPTVLVAYRAEIETIFDSRDEEALARENIDREALSAHDWRDQMKAKGEARTQNFARRLMAAGYSGLLTRSFAPGAGEADKNLVLWRWGDQARARLIVIDDEKRLLP